MSWAEAGSPDYVTAARHPDGRYTLCGLSHTGRIIFELPLPDRGHAAAAHPSLPVAVAFARRPGRFALIVDCVSGRSISRLEAPVGRHFYGHGTFSMDGMVLYTTENDFEAARGVIGLWSVEDGYRRIGEIDSAGVGPHDLLRLPGTDDLVVANGGIETHPDTGRTKLNLPVMRPNLAYLSPTGDVLDQLELDPALHKNSIRHLDVSASGEVAFAMQWQGPERDAPPLLGLHRPGVAMRLLSAPPAVHSALLGYAGSVAFSGGGDTVAITSPRGGVAHSFARATGALVASLAVSDGCGLARGTGAAFQLTSGSGASGAWDGSAAWAPHHSDRAFDNHLVAI